MENEPVLMVTIGVVIGIFFERVLANRRTQQHEPEIKKVVITIVKAEYINGVMYVEYSDESKKEFKGDCTVWSELPFMDRCDSFTETRLLEIWKYLEHYGGVYPLSHLKK
tara:strand:- start:831 stop:1160 length:330 start_codon:yes stop_codon:yes gene_type:complete